MEGYLGEFDVDLRSTPYADYNKELWALEWIEMYGGIDGAHHKSWTLDQVARILNNTSVIIKEARWDNGLCDYRLSLGNETQEYLDWVYKVKGWNETEQAFDYDHDEGIAP